MKIFEEAKNKKEEVVCILISSGFSGTYQGAMLAKSMVDYEGIYIIDSKCAAAAEKQIAFYACELREKGMSGKEIAEELEKFRSRVRLIACLDTLEYLAKGGRISKAAAAIGDMANLKPIITVSREGTVEVIGKGIGVNRTLSAIQKKIAAFQIDENYPVYSLFSYGEENCEKLEQKMEKNGCKIYSRKQIGPAIGTHIGPEAFGVCFVEKK